MAHEALDRAVAAAYGWDDYTPAMPDEEILRRLLALNHERAAIGSASCTATAFTLQGRCPRQRSGG
jgi:hypothetical protein